MKKYLLAVLFLLLIPISVNAQNLLTRFLNIPENWTEPQNIIYFVFIPFFGTFTVIWGILTSTKAKIFENKKVNVLLSLIFAVALFYSGIMPAIVLYLFAYGGVFAVIIFFILFFVLTSLFGAKKIGIAYKETEKVYREAKKIEDVKVVRAKDLDVLEKKLEEKQKKLDKAVTDIRASNSLLDAINRVIRDRRCHLPNSPDHSKWLKIKDGVRHITNKNPSTVGLARRYLTERARDKQRDATILDTEILALRTKIDQIKDKL